MEGSRSRDGDVDSIEDWAEKRSRQRPKRPLMVKRAVLHSNAAKQREDDARYQLDRGERYIVSAAPPMTFGPYTKRFLSNTAMWYLKDIPWSKTEKLEDIAARRNFAAKVKHYATRHNLIEEFKDVMEDMNLIDFKEIVKERRLEALNINIGEKDGTGDLTPYFGDDEKGIISTKSLQQLAQEVADLEFEEFSS